MGHDDAGHAGVHQALDDGQHLADHFGIQRGGGLVEQHHFRLHGQRAHDGQALLLSAGQAVRVLVLLLQKAHAVEQLLGQLIGLGLGLFAQHDGRQRDVLLHRLVREDVEVLEHHAHVLAQLVDVGALGGQLGALVEHLALLRDFQKVQAAQERALAGAGRADDGNDLALLNLFVDALQHVQLAEGLVQIDDLNHRPSASSHRWKSACSA